MEMTSQISQNRFRQWSKEIGQAVVILILTICLSVYIGDFTFLKGSEAIYKGLLRFSRITLLLCLPIYLLFPIFRGILLSSLWTLDDMGIRYFNRKNHEIRMIGKYAGTLMPILFGFYGVFGLFSQFQRMEAFVYLFQIVVILYPPFAVFSVFHTHFLQKRGEPLLHKLLNKKGDLGNEEE